jgi:hypothetical protein
MRDYGNYLQFDNLSAGSGGGEADEHGEIAGKTQEIIIISYDNGVVKEKKDGKMGKKGGDGGGRGGERTEETIAGGHATSHHTTGRAATMVALPAPPRRAAKDREHHIPHGRRNLPMFGKNA